MTHPPKLTDRTALARNRARAAAAGFADFLHRAAADEINQRLGEVNRTFTRPAVVTGFPAFWQAQEPGALVVEDTETLPFEAGAHDLVIHALALHWADDPVGQLIQCRRALRPDGLFLAACFGGQTLAELRIALAEAEAEVLGGLSPRVVPMADIRDMGALLQRAGLALPVADSAAFRVTYPDAFRLMSDLRAMGEGNALAARHKAPPPRALFARAAEIYAARFGTDDGRLHATFDIIFLTGWAPHPDQAKPLRPGSAQARLADALGTAEIGAGDRAAPDKN